MPGSFKIPRKWLMLICIGIGMLFILVMGNIILNRVIQHKVSEKLQQLSPQLKISFSSVKSNLLNSSLFLNNLKIDYIPDSNKLQRRHAIYFSAIELHGIHFFTFLFRHILSVNHVKISNGQVKLDRFLLNKKDTLQKNVLAQAPFQSISIGHFEVTAIDVWEHADQDNKLLLRGNIEMDEISIDDIKKRITTDNFHFGAFKSSLSEINYGIPDAYHTLKIKQVTIDGPNGTIQINSMKMVPGYNKSDFLKKAGNQPLYIESTIDNITIFKPDMRKLLLDKKLIAGKIIFDHPVFNVDVGSQQPLSRSFLLIYLKKNLLEIQTDVCRMNNSSIIYEGATGGQLNLTGNIGIDKLKISTTDSTFNNNDIRFSAFTCALADIHCSLPGSYHHIQIKKLLIDRSGTLQIAALKIIPRYNKLELGQKAGHQTDVVDATISGIEIVKLDIPMLLRKKLMAEKIWIKESNIAVFRDRRLPRLLQYQPLPVAFLKSIPLHIRVSVFKVANSVISYEEFPKDGLQTGILKIEKFQLSLSPLISHPGPSDPDHMTMNVEGAIMGSGTIRASVNLPFASGKDYYISGSIDNLDLTSLNSAAENLGKFHIESGMLNNLAFDFSFNDEKATGKVVGAYHQLVVDKLKGQDKKTAKFQTFMLKHVIIPKDKDQSLPVARRTGRVDYKFDHTRFISFYLLKSLLSGIESSFTFGFLLPK